jgi:hypothetical protein
MPGIGSKEQQRCNDCISLIVHFWSGRNLQGSEDDNITRVKQSKMSVKISWKNYSVIKKNEILSFAGKWTELDIKLSEVSSKDKGHMFSLMYGN